MPTATEATTQLARQQQGGQVEKQGEGKTLVGLLKSNEKEIAAALPASGVTPQQLIRVAVTCVKQNPTLGRCSPESVAGALMQAAHVGLLPGGTLGHAHLVPYKNGREYEAQFQIGWQGLVQLARRSGEVDEIWADVIRENDVWTIKRGLDRDLIHEPAYGKDRGEVIFAYAVVKYRSGARDWIVLDRDDLDKRQQQSQTGRNNRGPWADHYDAMARKSAIKALAPFLPLTLDDQRAFGADGGVVKFDPADPANLEDIEHEPYEVEVVETRDTPLDDTPDPAEEGPGPEVDTATGEVDLKKLTKAQLVLRCHQAGLDTEGTKDDLVARLRGGGQSDNDGEQEAHEPEEGEGSDGDTSLEEGEEPELQPDDAPPPEEPEEDDLGDDVDTALQRRKLFARLREHGVTEDQRKALLLGQYGVESLNELDTEAVDALIADLADPDTVKAMKATADDWIASEGA